jgi:hypothetical protein
MAAKAHWVSPQHRSRTARQTQNPLWDERVAFSDAFAALPRSPGGSRPHAPNARAPLSPREATRLAPLGAGAVGATILVTVHDAGRPTPEMIGQVAVHLAGLGAEAHRWFCLVGRAGVPVRDQHGNPACIRLRVRYLARAPEVCSFPAPRPRAGGQARQRRRARGQYGRVTRGRRAAGRRRARHAAGLLWRGVGGPRAAARGGAPGGAGRLARPARRAAAGCRATGARGALVPAHRRLLRPVALSAQHAPRGAAQFVPLRLHP